MTAADPVLAVDLGGTKTLVALVSADRVIDRIIAPTDPAVGPDGWIDQIAQLSAPWRGRFSRVGITVTGLVTDGLWSALNPATLAIPPRFALLARAQAALGLPVTLANDAQAAAWGEFRYGAGQGRDVVFLTISTGIGGGVVTGGRLLTGRSGLAGHFGQFISLTDAHDSTVFEDAASGGWIGRQGLTSANAVFDAARHGDITAERLIAQSAVRVARLCRNLQLAFDPAVIVIGGGVGLADGYLDRINMTLAPLDPVFRPTLARAALGPDAGVIGIAALTEVTQLNKEERQ